MKTILNLVKLIILDNLFKFLKFLWTVLMVFIINKFFLTYSWLGNDNFIFYSTECLCEVIYYVLFLVVLFMALEGLCVSVNYVYREDNSALFLLHCDSFFNAVAVAYTLLIECFYNFGI